MLSLLKQDRQIVLKLVEEGILKSTDFTESTLFTMLAVQAAGVSTGQAALADFVKTQQTMINLQG